MGRVTPRDVKRLLSGLPIDWWIAGGWALDIEGGSRTRTSTSPCSARPEALREHLADWDLWIAHARNAAPLDRRDRRPAREAVWARPTPGDRWHIDFKIEAVEGDEWVYRRDPAVRRRVGEIGVVVDGIPYLARELAQLYASATSELCEPESHPTGRRDSRVEEDDVRTGRVEVKRERSPSRADEHRRERRAVGRRIVTRDEEIETDDSTSETRRPAVPLNVRRAFCPGVVIATVRAGAPATSSPEMSAGTSCSASVIEPVFAPVGSTTIEYVPLEGRRRASTNAPAVPTSTLFTNTEPSGASTDT